MRCVISGVINNPFQVFLCVCMCVWQPDQNMQAKEMKRNRLEGHAHILVIISATITHCEFVSMPERKLVDDKNTLRHSTQTQRKRENKIIIIISDGAKKIRRRRKKREKKELRKTHKEKKNWYVEQLSFYGMHYDD